MSLEDSFARASDALSQPGTLGDVPRLKLDALDTEVVRPLTNAEYCERVYAGAEGDCDRVPWAHHGPDELLVQWLNREAPRLVRPGSRAVVVGCGLGDDVAELDKRGFDVLGFDVSPSAVRWAARRHPRCAGRFMQADLLDLPARLAGRFDLVIEVCTLQSLAPDLRALASRGLSRLAASRGIVLAVACGRRCAEECGRMEGPPWPLSTSELASLMGTAGLAELGGVREVEASDHEHLRVMGVFVRG
jgi:SAM-dependent methyltransferase